MTGPGLKDNKPAGFDPALKSCALACERLLLALLACLLINPAANAQQQAPELLTYDELVQLYEQEMPPDALQGKLHRLLTTPFVSNSATSSGARPLLPKTARLGQFLRVVQWNIERGLEYDAVRSAFTEPAGFAKHIDSTAYRRGSEKRKLILQPVALMKQADVIVLNEVDWGMKRTDYRNLAAELATALGMNYAYGAEFVEVDPMALGLEKFEELEPEERAKFASEIRVDRTRYRGLHGTAILSRFTLESLNNALEDRISDHSPIMVDLPLAEPPLVKAKRRRTVTKAT
jgi:hypothetical protein